MSSWLSSSLSSGRTDKMKPNRQMARKSFPSRRRLTRYILFCLPFMSFISRCKSITFPCNLQTRHRVMLKTRRVKFINSTCQVCQFDVSSLSIRRVEFVNSTCHVYGLGIRKPSCLLREGFLCICSFLYSVGTPPSLAACWWSSATFQKRISDVAMAFSSPSLSAK